MDALTAVQRAVSWVSLTVEKRAVSMAVQMAVQKGDSTAV